MGKGIGRVGIVTIDGVGTVSCTCLLTSTFSWSTDAKTDMASVVNPKRKVENTVEIFIVWVASRLIGMNESIFLKNSCALCILVAS